MADGGLAPRISADSATAQFAQDRAASSDPSKLESAAEEQQNELEALQSIYGELSLAEASVPGPKSGVHVILGTEGVGARVFDVAIAADDDPDGKPGDKKASCMLRVAYSPLYPDSAPHLDIVGPFSGFRASEAMRDRMVSGLSDLSRRSVGMSHVHLLVDEAASRLLDEARLAAGGGGSLYEQLMRKREDERRAQEAAEREAEEAKRRAAVDEAEREARASRSVAGLSKARREGADEEDDDDGLAARARRGWGTKVTKESFAAWRLGFFTQRVQAFVDEKEGGGGDAAVAGGASEARPGDGDGGETGAAASGGGGAEKTAAEEARDAAMEEFENTSKLPVPPTPEEAKALWKRAAGHGLVEGGLGTLVVGGLVVPGSRLPPIMGKMQGEPVSSSTGKQFYLDQAAKGGAGTMAVGADQAAALEEAAAALRQRDAGAASGAGGGAGVAAAESGSHAPASLLEGVDLGLMEAVAAGLGDEDLEGDLGDLDDDDDDDELDDDDDDDDDGGVREEGGSAPAAVSSGAREQSVGSTGAGAGTEAEDPAGAGGNASSGEADYRAMLVRSAISGAEAASVSTAAGRLLLSEAVANAKQHLEELKCEAEGGKLTAGPVPTGGKTKAGTAPEGGEGDDGGEDADGGEGDAASRRDKRRARRAKRRQKKEQ